MIDKILVINLMYIGDLLFSTPLLCALRSAFPTAHITMLADAKQADVIRYNQNINEISAIDKKGYHNRLGNFIRLIRDVRKQQYDLVINLHPNERASAIAAFSGGKKIIGFSSPGLGLFFDQVVEESKDVHQADAYLKVLQAIDVETSNNSHQGLEMPSGAEAEISANQLWQEAFPNKNDSKITIGLNIGGSWPTKRWTKAGFAHLADLLLNCGYRVVFFGGPMDVADVEQITNDMELKNSTNLAVFTGKTTLLEMAALVRKCSAFVSGDSGPMHIAVSQKVPVLAIFGPSNPIRYAPYMQSDRVIKASLPCLGCGKHDCAHHSCMHEISAEEVLSRVLAIIA